MKIRYDGPRGEIRVLSEGKVVVHRKNKVEDYPDEVAADLLAEKKNKFVSTEPTKVTETGDRRPETGDQGSGPRSSVPGR